MTRFRALAFGKPLAAWQATPELAMQSAIEADNGHRDPSSGRVFLSPGVEIEDEEGEVQTTPDVERWAEALAIIRNHEDRARRFVNERIAAASDDYARVAHWRMIRSRIVQIMNAAAKDA